jgi:hypothetical protein
MMYSVLEQHRNGAWWYHPGYTFGSEKEAEQCFQDVFGNMAPERPHRIFEHEEPLYQEQPTCTFDFKTFEFSGKIFWPESLKGTYVGQTGIRQLLSRIDYLMSNHDSSLDYEAALEDVRSFILEREQEDHVVYKHGMVESAEEYAQEKEKEAGCGTEFTTHELAEAFHAGKLEMKKQLMACSGTGTVWRNEAGFLYVPVFIGLRDKKPGDKVRVAIIKED